MICKHCSKILPITKVLKAKNDAVSCIYCKAVVASEDIAWKDGRFHFRIIGDVKVSNIKPRILLDNQTSNTLDIEKIKDTARSIISSEPNLNAICQEFSIKEEDIYVEVLSEK